MKQLVIGYEALKNEEALSEKLAAMRSEKTFFHGYVQVFSELLDKNIILEVKEIVGRVAPELPFFAVTTAANVVDCEVSDQVTIVFCLFESESSRVAITQYDLNSTFSPMVAKQIVDFANENNWIKGIEIYYTTNGQSTTLFCDSFEELRNNVDIAGGVVCSPMFSEVKSLIYCDKFSSNGVIALYLGGEDIYIQVTRISGWKPIGRMFHVTASKGNLLMELNGVPAYDVYRKYLNIANDENFFENALEFPVLCEHNGITIARCPMASLDDGSVQMSADITANSIVRLSYGDPSTILREIEERSSEVKAFQPDVVHIFSCAARREFWSEKTPTYELAAFKGLHTTGFFSHGEFAREKGHLNQHNITLVLAGIREGEPRQDHNSDEQPVKLSTRLPLASRMATFIREMTFELDQINGRLEAVNEQLQEVATIDPLTGMNNRLVFDDLLNTADRDQEKAKTMTMIMFDINGLKYINDTFGHLVGDKVIAACGSIIKKVYGDDASFRIGGDEFVVVISASNKELKNLHREFDRLVDEYNQQTVYHFSIAYGASGLCDNKGNIKTLSDWKMDADLSMYQDKAESRSTGIMSKQGSFAGFISCLISVEEAKDPYTAHHSERVRELTELIVKKLGLSTKTEQIIVDAAYLHDIGKVGISDAILGKPGKLTNEEFAVIKEHPVIGARILMKSNHMQEIVRIVLHHHERYDGKGYPDNLAGEDIPLGARIVAIADSIDAMTSRRVYRDALSLDFCREEIVKNLGVMYDPAIGRVTLNHWEEIVEILLAHSGEEQKSD